MAATHFDIIRAHARKIGADVRREGNYACWDRIERRIYIPMRHRGREAVFLLLHETGHVIVDRGGRFDDVDAFVHESGPTWRGRAWAVAEEWEAWEAGWALSRRLGLQLDRLEYDKFAAAHVASYVHEAGTAKF